MTRQRYAGEVWSIANAASLAAGLSLLVAGMVSAPQARADDRCANPSRACAGFLQSRCLTALGPGIAGPASEEAKLGAGAIAAGQANPGPDAACRKGYADYGACLSDIAATCGATAAEGLAVDLGVADIDDPAVREAVYGTKYIQLGAPYVLETLSPGDGSPDSPALRIRPASPYFNALAEVGAGYHRAFGSAFFDWEEGTTDWPPSTPLLDLIMDRVDRDLTLSNLVVEVAESAPDLCPYAEVFGSDSDVGKFLVINQSGRPIVSAEAEFDILITETDAWPNDAEIDRQNRAFLKAVAEQGDALSFAHRAQVGGDSGFGAVTRVDVAALVNRAVARRPAGERSAYPAVLQGRLTTRAKTDGACDELVSYFRVPVALTAPEGVGGGFLNFQLGKAFRLLSEGRGYQQKLRVGYRLDEADPSFRALIGLHVQESSRHVLRLSAESGGETVWRSPWIEAHIFMPAASLSMAN